MTQLEKLYNAIESLKELGVALPQELIENTNMVEEEIIQNEVIPALSEAIEPIISQIQRELILVVEYVPDEPLQVRMTRKRSFKIPEPMDATPVSTNAVNNERKFTIAPHSKSKKTNLVVTFPDGTRIENQFAYQTFCQAIEKIGPERVTSLNIRQCGINIVSKEKDDFYNQHTIPGGWLVLTHSSTALKKEHLEQIARQLKFPLKVEIV